jgi:protoporphyrinogen oxidase
LTVSNAGEAREFVADILISTLPYPISCGVMKDVLGETYVQQQNKRKYLYAINLILKTKKPILSRTYWLNIGAKDIPIMCIVQHTNFINSKQYGGDEICYVAWYVEEDSILLKKNEKEMLEFVLPYLKGMGPKNLETPEVVALFKAPYAQPIFDSEFITIPRSFSTPAKNIYMANMDMTYPYDRGTNFAVQLGKDVSNFILKGTSY